MSMTQEGRDAEDAASARIFISYSRRDLAFVDRLDAALRARGFVPLIDRSEIVAFEDWWKRIENLIVAADTVVFVLSPDSATSDVAAREVAFAASLNKRFAPIVCRRVADELVPEPLRRLNFLFFDDPERFDASMERLVEALFTDIEWVRRHTELGEQARRWGGAGRPGPGGLMLRPPVLDQAEAWLTFRPRGAPEPTEETRAFIATSRTAFEQEEAARREQVNRRLISESRRLADLATREIAAGNCGAAIALALEALPDAASGVARPYVPAAERTLFAACRALKERPLFKVADRAAIEDSLSVIADFSPDGRRVATAASDGIVRVWEAASGALVATMTVAPPSAIAQFWQTRAAYSPDGRLLVTWLKDQKQNRILIWDAESGAKQTEIALPEEPRVAFAVFAPASSMASPSSPLGRFLDGATRRLGLSPAAKVERLLVGVGRIARIYDAANGQELATFPSHQGDVLAGEFSRDGFRAVTGSADQTARIWDAATGEERVVLHGHVGKVVLAKFDADGARVMTGCADRGDGERECHVRIWDAATGKQLARSETHRNPGVYRPQSVTSASFAPDPDRALSASEDGAARIWNAANGEIMHRLRLRAGMDRTTAAFSHDGTRVLMAAGDLAAIWDASNGERIESFRGHADKVSGASYNADESRVLTASSDGTARIWQVTPDGPLELRGSQLPDFRFDDPNQDEWLATARGVGVAAFSPDGSRIVTIALAPNVAILWDAATGRLITQVDGRRAGFSRDGSRILISTWYRTLDSLLGEYEDNDAGHVTVLTAASGEKLASFAIGGSDVKDIVFNQDQARVVLSARGSSAAIRIHEELADVTVRLAADETSVTTACPDGYAVEFVREDFQIRVRAVSPDESRVFIDLSGSLNPDARLGLLQDSNGRELAEVKTRRVWNARDERLSWSDEEMAPYGPKARFAEFSPDGLRLLTVMSDATVRIWDAESGRELMMLAFKGEATAARFTPDGTRVLTASWDGTVRLWDAASGVEVARIQEHDDRVWDAAMSPDGTRVVTAFRGGAARIWPVFSSTQALVDHAKTRVGRGLTPREREGYFLDLEPPLWMIENDIWPYHTAEWKQWLSDVRAGRNPALPKMPL